MPSEDDIRNARGRDYHGRVLPRTSLLQGLSACACVAASIVAVACGGEDTSTSAELPAGAGAANIVQADDLGRVPEDSPDRALLEWFQAVQFRDVVGVRQLTAPATVSRVTPAALDRAVNRIGGSLARPQIVGRRLTSTQAVLRLLLLSYSPASSRPTATTPSTFSLAKIGGAWRLTDVSVLFPKRTPRPKPVSEVPPRTTTTRTTTTSQ
jgi:hypothetical protein